MFLKFSRTIVDWSGYLAGLATVLILVLVCVEVVARLMGSSTMIADEFAGYLNAAIIFLGLGYALREGAFIRVEIFYDKFKGLTLTTVQWIIVLSSLVFSIILFYFLGNHALYAFEQNIRAVSVVETPEWVPMTIVTAGCAVLVLQLMLFIVTRFKNLP